MWDDWPMSSALLRCGHRRLCKSTAPVVYSMASYSLFIAPGHSDALHIRSPLPLPLLAGVEAELHPVSVGHMSMDAEMEQPLQGSVPLSINIEGEPRIGNGSIVENPASDLVKSESDRIKTFYQTVLSAIMVFVMAALSSYKDMKPLYSTTSHNKARLSSLLIDEGLFIFMTFLWAVVLMMSEFFVYQYGRRGRVWCWVLTILITVTGVMLIVADTILLVVVNRSNMLLSVLLGPVVLLVGVAVTAGAWMREEPSSEFGSRYDAAMKVTFDMATVGTIVSFTLQGGIVFGYLKTPGSKQVKLDPPLDLAACYATSTLSLIGMMVCAMPLVHLPEDMLKVLVIVVERLRSAVLAALAMMALVVSVEFLDFVVLSFFTEAVAIVLYYVVKLFLACQPREGSSPLDFTFRMVAAAGFTLMTGLYSAFMGTDHYDFYLKTAMFILLLAILSSLSRLAIPVHMPDAVAGVGGVIEFGIAGVALASPLLALLAAIPLVLKVFVDHYVNR